ncbi:MAG TPA: hypothetical protein VGK41_01255 [Solirubrobacterales bacterium]
MDRITEHAVAKLLTKVILPLLSVCLIPLLVAQWNGLTKKVGDVQVNQERQAEKLSNLGQEVTTINTKLDAGLIWRLTQLERRFDAMEARVERRETDQRSP